MPNITIYDPSAFLSPGEQGYPETNGFRKFLAQGDSWFSLGALPFGTTNILYELSTSAKAMAVNCAGSGFELKRMVDRVRSPDFTQLLVGHQAWAWDGILMSAGGNDLIEAVQVKPFYGKNHALQDQPVPADKRLLLKSSEWKAGGSADRYISDPGWATFTVYLSALFKEVRDLRDSAHSLSKGVPVFVHCYDYLVPRDAPAASGIGPWLYPAVTTYGIPQGDWPALGQALIERFKALLQGIAMPGLVVVDTTGTLTPAAAGSSGASNDWVNEIHPTKAGYQKLARKYAQRVDAVFA